ncbi:MAG: hypothetical protein IT440_10460 [Phycisphaeraceae bacterium]|nr:hypothetical protein [Phycisphaeraceae bacterium]
MEADLWSIASKTRYHVGAFIFVQRGLDYTVRRIHGEPSGKANEEENASRHVSGQQLCQGLRDFAIEQYGLLARTVLRRWHIYRCEDFGHIVFAMIDAGMMRKTDQDNLDDFHGVFDFADAFSNELQLR